jgi:amino acid transporter
MTDYKSPRNRNPQIQFEYDPIRDSNPIATLAALVGIGVIMVLLVVSCADSIDRTLDNQAKHNGAPAAFRKKAPTHEQMWALDHLTNVSKVAHAERYQP